MSTLDKAKFALMGLDEVPNSEVYMYRNDWGKYVFKWVYGPNIEAKRQSLFTSPHCRDITGPIGRGQLRKLVEAEERADDPD